jgi:hypothetical protein
MITVTGCAAMCPSQLAVITYDCDHPVASSTCRAGGDSCDSASMMPPSKAPICSPLRLAATAACSLRSRSLLPPPPPAAPLLAAPPLGPPPYGPCGEYPPHCETGSAPSSFPQSEGHAKQVAGTHMWPWRVDRLTTYKGVPCLRWRLAGGGGGCGGGAWAGPGPGAPHTRRRRRRQSCRHSAGII